MASVVAGEAARDGATTASTKEKRALAWRRWLEFLKQIEYTNHPSMESLERWQRVSLLCAFAQCLRDALFSSSVFDSLASGTVQSTVDYVASSIRIDRGFDPRHDDSGCTSQFLLQQYKSYKLDDKNAKHQKAIPQSVLLELRKHNKTVEDTATHQLACGAWFFCMRSCEYSETPKNEEKLTKLLCLRNLEFRNRSRVLDHTDPDLHLAATITITYESQKNGESWESITMHGNPDDELCCVRIWAAIVRRILSYPGTDQNSKVSTILVNGKLSSLRSSTILLKIRSIISIMGEERTGLLPKDVGTHSIRSGGAMAMYLEHIQPFTIMLIGRWRSEAFLKYIRKQVEQFSHNVAHKMQRRKDFYTTPDFEPNRNQNQPAGTSHQRHAGTSHQRHPQTP